MTWVTLDFETCPIQRGYLAPKIVCGSWRTGPYAPVQIARRVDFPFRDLLRAGVIDGANTTYDLTCAMAADLDSCHDVIDAYLEGRVRDVQLDWRLWDIQRGIPIEGKSYALDTLAAHLQIAVEKDDGWRLRFGELDGLHPDHYPQGARDYSLWDTDVTSRVRLSIPEVQPQHIYQIAAGADWALHLMSCWGVQTSPKRVEQVAERVRAHISNMEGALVEAGLVRRNLDAASQREWGRQLRASARQQGVDPKILKQQWEIQGHGCPDGSRSDLAAAARMIRVMTEQGRRRQIVLSEAGEAEFKARTAAGEDGPKVHEEIISKIVRGRALVKLDKDAAILSGDELLITRAEWTTSNRLLGRVERLRAGYSAPLQTSFDSIKETFRTSSRQPMPPLVGEQMQNFDRGEEGELGLREGFEPRPGYIFIGADVGQAELCSLAELCYKMFGHTRMGELLNAGVDLHWYLAATSLGVSLEEIKALGKSHRSRAKPANFGFPGGMGPEKFVLYSRKGYGVRFTIEEAKELKQKWLQAYPEMSKYLAWVSRQIGKRRSFEHVHPISGYRRGGVGYTDGANHGFQHLTAVATKTIMPELTAECYDPRRKSALFGSRPWDFVHDEFLAEAPWDPELRAATAAAERMAALMESIYNRWTPNFPTKVEPWVSSVWTKENSGVRDPKTGLLVDYYLHKEKAA